MLKYSLFSTSAVLGKQTVHQDILLPQGLEGSTSPLHVVLPWVPHTTCSFGNHNTSVLKYFAKVIGKQLCWSPLITKLQAWEQKTVQPNDCVPLTICHHLYFLSFVSLVRIMSHHGSVGRFQIVFSCLHIFFVAFHQTIHVFIIFNFFFFFWMNYEISTTEYWPIRNRHWWLEIVSGTACNGTSISLQIIWIIRGGSQIFWWIWCS